MVHILQLKSLFFFFKALVVYLITDALLKKKKQVFINKVGFRMCKYIWLCTPLYNVILRIARNLLETRVIIKISTHPCCPRNWLIFMGMKQKKNYLIPIRIRPNFFAKISGIGPFNYFFFASSPWKSVNIYRVARIFRNFDDYPGFQSKTTPA